MTSTAEQGPATISVEAAAKLLGISRGVAYREAGRSIPVLRFGRRLRVPVKAVERMLEDAKQPNEC